MKKRNLSLKNLSLEESGNESPPLYQNYFHKFNHRYDYPKHTNSTVSPEKRNFYEDSSTSVFFRSRDRMEDSDNLLNSMEEKSNLNNKSNEDDYSSSDDDSNKKSYQIKCIQVNSDEDINNSNINNKEIKDNKNQININENNNKINLNINELRKNEKNEMSDNNSLLVYQNDNSDDCINNYNQRSSNNLEQNMSTEPKKFFEQKQTTSVTYSKKEQIKSTSKGNIQNSTQITDGNKKVNGNIRKDKHDYKPDKIQKNRRINKAKDIKLNKLNQHVNKKKNYKL